MSGNGNGSGVNRAAEVLQETEHEHSTSVSRRLQYIETIASIATSQPGEEIRISVIELDGNTLACVRIWRDGLPKRSGLFLTPRQCSQLQKALDPAKVKIMRRIKENQA